MTTPEFTSITPIIKIEKKENGKLLVKANTHIIDDVDPSDLRYIAFPYAGRALNIEVHCEDPELRQRVCLEFDKATDLYPYFDPELPVAANCFENLRFAYERKNRFKSLRSLEKSCNDIPILFVAAGPSTLENIETIRKIVDENKAVVIAGGSGNRVLDKHGIQPHFGLVFDPRISEFTEVFHHLSDDYLKNVPFITNQTLHPSCFSRLQEAFVGCSSSLTDLNEFLEPEEVILPEGRIGVSTMAPYLADYMGCKQLFLIGVDLCFDENGERYSDIKSSVRDKDENKFELYGKITRPAWAREAKDIADTVQKVDMPVFNCSRQSLLHFGEMLPTIDLNRLLSFESKRAKYKLIDKKQDLNLLLTKFEVLNNDLHHLSVSFEDMMNGRIGKENNALRCLLYTYHVLQQLREIRTGDYNEPLMRQVISNMQEYVKKGLYEQKKRLPR